MLLSLEEEKEEEEEEEEEKGREKNWRQRWNHKGSSCVSSSFIASLWRKAVDRNQYVDKGYKKKWFGADTVLLPLHRDCDCGCGSHD